MADLTYTTTFADADWTLDVEVNAAGDGWSLTGCARSDENGETVCDVSQIRLPRAVVERIEDQLREAYGLRMPYGS